MSENNEENDSVETPGIVETIKNAVGLGDDSAEVDDAPADENTDPANAPEADVARKKYRSSAALVIERKRKAILAR